MLLVELGEAKGQEKVEGFFSWSSFRTDVTLRALVLSRGLLSFV